MTVQDLEFRMRSAKATVKVLEFRPGGKYIVFVDPSVCDFEALPDISESAGLGFEVQFIAAMPPAGKTLDDCVKQFTEVPLVLA